MLSEERGGFFLRTHFYHILDGINYGIHADWYKSAQYIVKRSPTGYEINGNANKLKRFIFRRSSLERAKNINSSGTILVFIYKIYTKFMCNGTVENFFSFLIKKTAYQIHSYKEICTVRELMTSQIFFRLNWALQGETPRLGVFVHPSWGS